MKPVEAIFVIAAAAFGAVIAVLGLQFLGVGSKDFIGPAAAVSSIAALLIFNARNRSKSQDDLG